MILNTNFYRQVLLLFILLIVFGRAAQAADNYAPGDSLYVWATSGLTLRTEVSTKAPRVRTIKFGELVKINENTSVKYNVKLVSKGSEDPLILYGQWVKVSVDDTLVGYIIDQYLLPIKPQRPDQGDALHLKLISFDT